MRFHSAAFGAAIVLALHSPVAPAQTLDDLRNDSTEPNNVLTYGKGYSAQRYSPLTQINQGNVGKLVPVWALSLENEFGEQGQPLIKDGVMYTANPKWTVAIDAVTGKQLWRTPTDFDTDSVRIVCCGVSTRGIALYNGMVLRGTIDAHLVALDQKTGKEIWKTKVADWKEGYSITGAPIVANGVLITGMAGAEFGVRGFVAGYDPATGQELWRRHTIPGPGEKGGDSWTVKDSYKNGGGSTWVTGTYDPELDLTYWGTGNAGPWHPEYRGGDSLYAASVVAIRTKTGEIVWAYQFTPGDPFDYDSIGEMILGDVRIGGQVHKGLMHFDKNGFLYVLDRANGKLLSANPFAKVTWASHVDMATGRPVETAAGKNLRAGNRQKFWPGALGGKNWAHAAFNPRTGLLYVNTINMASEYEFIKMTEPFKPGVRYQGIKDHQITSAPGEPKGYMEAIDPVTAKAKWRVPLDDVFNLSSMLATGSGLLFTGRHSGEFLALDAETGKQLWQFQTSSGINASPVTWSHNGRQYVTVLAGLGGVGWRWMDNAKNIPRGGSVWTFALPQ